MIFASLEFLFVFLPLVTVAYLASRNTRWREIVLFVASIGFYAWGEPVFVFLMLLSVLINWALALVLDSRRSRRARASWLVVGIALNLAGLVLFKYAGLGLSIVGSLTGTKFASLGLPLPLGISFYSFQALAYLIDLYRGDFPAQRDPLKLTLVIASFQTITAGPILRYKDMHEQLASRSVTRENAAYGIRRILIGLGKKVLISNSVAFLASQIFSFAPQQYGAIGAWIGALSWTLQIYFDFSGYSDIAIGLGSLFGFRYPENFNYPYISRSVGEFWRRWHISLSSFFRDYVYIPLGGNRVSVPRWVLNMAVVWALTGLWHGANLTFVLWGLYYGLLIVLERLFLGRVLERLPRFVSHAYLLLIVVVGWVLFMSPTAADALRILGAMAGLNGLGSVQSLVLMRVVQPLYAIAFMAGLVGSVPWVRSVRARRLAEAPVIGYATDALLVLVFAASVVMIAVNSFTPFLYFRF